ncbi:MAG: PTS sugar transporter subunit IIB [Atopobiaceae bacterium]|nr:PTS sugar transporter subunit IIB [Atopobiaceae bacterium]MCI1388330.1 PTS sugar transporter subunit IIB [Atopobiaceae bacterium]
MANAVVKFMRVDTRMVHGQIITKWTTINQCKHVMIIDKLLDSDPFMSSFYKKAAQKGVKIDVTSPEKAKKAWDNDKFGPSDKNLLVVFRDATNAYNTWKLGFPMEALDLGNQVDAAGKKQISREVFLSEDEFNKLKEMNDAGVHVYMQVIPEDTPTEFDAIAKVFNS